MSWSDLDRYRLRTLDPIWSTLCMQPALWVTPLCCSPPTRSVPHENNSSQSCVRCIACHVSNVKNICTWSLTVQQTLEWLVDRRYYLHTCISRYKDTIEKDCKTAAPVSQLFWLHFSTVYGSNSIITPVNSDMQRSCRVHFCETVWKVPCNVQHIWLTRSHMARKGNIHFHSTSSILIHRSWTLPTMMQLILMK